MSTPFHLSLKQGCVSREKSQRRHERRDDNRLRGGRPGGRKGKCFQRDVDVTAGFQVIEFLFDFDLRKTAGIQKVARFGQGAVHIAGGGVTVPSALGFPVGRQVERIDRVFDRGLGLGRQGGRH